MISDALTFLAENLNRSLELSLGDKDSTPEYAALIRGDRDPLQFVNDAVSVMVVGFEEEKTLRAADRHMRTSVTGQMERIQPDIRLNLFVLFVAKFSDYTRALRNLSLTIQHFQKSNVFDHNNAADLSEGIEQLIMELHTTSLSEQHELWQAIGKTYHPSVLYKVKMVVFQDESGVKSPPITDRELDMRGAS